MGASREGREGHGVFNLGIGGPGVVVPRRARAGRRPWRAAAPLGRGGADARLWGAVGGERGGCRLGLVRREVKVRHRGGGEKAHDTARRRRGGSARGEVEMLQGGTGGGEDWGRSAWPARWPTPAVSAVTARKQRGDGGDGKLVNNSKFQNFIL